MLLSVDMQGALTAGSRQRGIGRYTRELISAMARAKNNDQMHLALNARHGEAAAEIERRYAALVGRHNISHYRSPTHSGAQEPADRATRRVAEIILRHHLAQRQADATLFTSLFEAAAEDVTPIDLTTYPSRLKVAILYDLIPLRFPELYLREKRAITAYRDTIETLRSADLLLTISDASRADAIELIGIEPSRIVNISAAADDHFRPQGLSPPQQQERARQLGIERPFVTYIAGSDPRKNLRGALEIFAALPRQTRRNHQLLLISDLGEVDRVALESAAAELGLEAGSLIIRKGIGDDDLCDLLNMARALLFPSRYEGFGLPVLEAMQCGTPVVVAANSSLLEIVDRPDVSFDVDDPVGAARILHRVLTDEDHHADLARWGVSRAREFTWSRTARLAWDAIASRLATAEPHSAAPASTSLLDLDAARHSLANALAEAPAPHPRITRIVDDLLYSVRRFQEGASRRLLIDVTMTSDTSVLTGIQRVVRRLTGALQALPARDDLLMLPVSIAAGRLSSVPGFGLDAPRPPAGGYPVEIRPGDDLFMLDSSWAQFPRSGALFDQVVANGGRIVTCVYDLIPELHPEACTDAIVEVHREWLVSAVARSHVLICISRTVATELGRYIVQNGLKRCRNQRIEWFHCGADIAPPGKVPPAREVADAFAAGRETALMVGTLEPRKGHKLALAAFERLWAEGHPMALCFVGKLGWNVEGFAERLRDHPEAGRRLHWFEDADDASLAHAYDHATVVLNCSVAEGFGLPLTEAASRGRHVICSDIPVFREVGATAASFFPPGDEAALAEMLRQWSLSPCKPAALSQPLTWQQSARRVHGLLYEDEAGPDWLDTAAPAA